MNEEGFKILIVKRVSCWIGRQSLSSGGERAPGTETAILPNQLFGDQNAWTPPIFIFVVSDCFSEGLCVLNKHPTDDQTIADQLCIDH